MKLCSTGVVQDFIIIQLGLGQETPHFQTRFAVLPPQILAAHSHPRESDNFHLRPHKDEVAVSPEGSSMEDNRSKHIRIFP